MSDSAFEDLPQQQAQDKHGVIGGRNKSKFYFTLETTSSIYGICNIYVTFKQRRISASAKHMCFCFSSTAHMRNCINTYIN